jgi:2-dehydropantoate 2-reductase
MHYAVIGGGNIGSLYGSNLSRMGHQVTIVDVDVNHVAAIQNGGLKVDGLHGEFTASVRATTEPSTVSDVDTALICVNGYSTQQAADTAATILNDQGFVVSLQNGLGNIETLVGTLGDDRVLAGLTFHSGDMQGPGHVSHTNEGPTFIGEISDGATDRLLQLSKHLGEADMDPVVESDIMNTIWGKFVHNCGINAICAITDLRPGHISAVPQLEEFQRMIIDEVLALVSAKGITLDDADPTQTIIDYSAKKFHRVSMVQHLTRGVRTEIDSLNGYVAAESPKYGLKAPMNDALTRIIKGREYQPQ